MTCPHDIVECDIAISDGYCPLCLVVDNQRLRAALEEISKGKGRYSMDRLEHAANTIEDMKAIAAAALQPKEGE